MEQQYKNWLLHVRGVQSVTANSYANAMNQISEHYSQNTNTQTNIFEIADQNKISEIAQDYSQAGRFSEFGYGQHSRFRAAISRYSEFFVHHNDRENGVTEEQSENYNQKEPATNFAYEKDLQTTLCAQISELFPGYRIFGQHNTGIEYSIGGRRIDVLLEDIETSDLVAVELKSGLADYKVFGQISMYLGLLQNQFPDKTITGVIVAGAIHESLMQACETTDRVSLKVYRMSLELEKA